jgi:hypothetical protein
MTRDRRVFVDAAFLDALLDAEHPAHGDASGECEALLGGYLRGGLVLYALDPPRPTDPRRTDVAAVCEVVKMRRWLRRAAGRVLAANSELELRVDDAAALVVIERFRIGEVAMVEWSSTGHGTALTTDAQRFRNSLSAPAVPGILAT